MWFGNLLVHLKSQIVCLVQSALKIVRLKDYPSLQALHKQSVIRNAERIVSDLTNALSINLRISVSSFWQKIQDTKVEI